MGYNSVADNTGLSSLPPKHQKCREIPIELDLTTVQGHRSWCQYKAHMWLPIRGLVINCNFSRICYRFRDIHA